MYACSFEGCNKKFNTANGKWTHLQNFHTPPIKCPHKDCDALVKRLYIKQHLRTKHGGLGNPFLTSTFKVIPKVLHSKENIDVKSKTVKEKSNKSSHKPTFICTVCKKAFLAKANKKRHEIEVHAKPILCPIRGCKTLLKPCSLKGHLFHRHNVDKEDFEENFVDTDFEESFVEADPGEESCSDCGVRLRNINLPIHRENCKNRNENLYKCKFHGCNQIYMSEQSLNIHTVKMHSITPMK